MHHLESLGVPLSRQAFTTNPFERIILEGYSGDDLIEAHEVFPLFISSFSRRLRPPPYAGRLERSVKYALGRPADEVYSTILSVGGLRQVCAVWAIKGYNARRTAVETWYNLLTRKSAEVAANSRKPTTRLLSYLGRKSTLSTSLAERSHSIGEEKQWCQPWYCVIPNCTLHSGQSVHLPIAGLSDGPPMISLSKEALQLFLSDLPHLSNIWISTAEAVILDRRIRERTQDIKRNTQVLLDLIQEDGTELDGRWEDMLLDPRIEPPSAREELRSAERVSPEPQLPAAEHSGDATASECVPNVVPPPISDATNAAMEPKLSISGLREDVNKTKRVEPGLMHQTPESGLVVADLENLAKAEPSHDSATTRNTSPADTVVNPRLCDSGSRLANVKLILYMWRDVFFVGVCLLQQVLGSASDTWSHLWGSETQVPAEMIRVKWKCVSTSLFY